MGGDHAPAEIVAGALAAQREHGIRVVLTGRRPGCASCSAGRALDEIPIVPAEDTLAMDEGALASLAPATVERRGGLPAGPARPGRRGGLGRLHRRDRGDRAAAAAAGARRAAARARRRAADPPGPTLLRRRRRDRRSQAGDAGPVRPARRRLRAGRATAWPSPGWACSRSAPSRARATSWPAARTSCWPRPAARRAAARASPGNVEGGDLLAGRST